MQNWYTASMPIPSTEQMQSNVEELKKALLAAEEQRVARNFKEVEAIARKWLTYELVTGIQIPELHNYLTSLEDDHSATESVKLLAVGLLGMARVYLNAGITAYKAGQIRQPQLETIQAVAEQTFARLHGKNTPEQTIDGNMILWYGEQQQDLARYQIALGAVDKAAETLEKAVLTLEYEHRQSPEEKHPVLYSTLTVLYLRLAEAASDAEALEKSLQVLTLSQQEQPNLQRRKDIAKKALKLLYQGLDGSLDSKARTGFAAVSHLSSAMISSFLGR